MILHTYSIKTASFAWRADTRFGALSRTEAKRGCRLLGGDNGDLRFNGYEVDKAGTHLVRPVLVSSFILSDEEASEIASEIVQEAYASLGAECVQHS